MEGDNMERRIYFAQQPKKHTFEIYYDGKPSGKMIFTYQVKDYISKTQLEEFNRGERIFIVNDAEKEPEPQPTMRRFFKKCSDNFNF